MNREKISVVVPAYNMSPWLPRSLDSLLAQTHRNLEIVVVNDGSTDDTRAVLEICAGKDNRIKVIHKDNGGVTAARLRGVAEATGDWIGFLDGDDVAEPQMYARLLQLAREHGTDIAHCGHQICFLDGRVEYVHRSGQIRYQNHQAGLWELLDNREMDMSLCTKLYRRELFEGIEDWMDTTIRNNEDLLMNYYLFDRAQSAVFEGVCPYHYILRPGSASYHGVTEHYIFDPIRVRQLLLQRCGPEMRDSVQQALMRNLLFNYGILTVDRDRRHLGAFRQRVRGLLLEQKKDFHLLSLRNKVLANMICVAPWSFHIAYRVYVKLFQREETH